MLKHILTFILCLIFLCGLGRENKLIANTSEKKFDAGSFLIDHVLDEHTWHIFKTKNNHATLYLPVILIYNGEFYFFSSKKFDHNGNYKNFQLREEDPYKGRIVALTKDENGNTIIDNKLPLDFSITKNVFALFMSSILLFTIFMCVANNYKKRGSKSPKGIAAVIEPIFLFVRNDIVYSNMGKKYGERFLPYLQTLFFFIVFCNILGLIPIIPFGANLTGNIAVTLCLALLTFATTLIFSGKHYWKEIINPDGVPWWMKIPIPIFPLIELVGVITKPVVLMIRLFANITAGHLVVLGFLCLIFIFGEKGTGLGFGISPVSIAFALFVNLLELLVAFVQAYIFTLLSSIYIAGALGYEGETTTK